MENSINVLSYFDGISCAQLALKKQNIKIKKYYASEIDKYAISITQKNFPETIQLGDVRSIELEKIPKIDLFVAGSPCTNLSCAGKRSGLSTKEKIEILTLEQYENLKLDGFEFDGQSYLFWEFIKALKILKPKYFLLENVSSMGKKWKKVFSDAIGVNYIEINSSLVSAQNRKRLYWTNIPGVEQPEDKKILLKNIVLKDALPIALHNLYGGFNETTPRVFEEKSPTVKTSSGGGHIPSFIKKSVINPVTFTETRTGDAKKIRRRARKETGKDFSPRTGKELTQRNESKSNCVTTSTTKEHLVVNFDKLVHSEKAVKYMDRRTKDGKRTHWDFGYHSDIKDEKSTCIVANFFKGVPNNVLKDCDCIRKFHPIECEKLQTLPENYTSTGVNDKGKVKISNTQRYKAIGNGMTVDVIAHILSYLHKK